MSRRNRVGLATGLVIVAVVAMIAFLTRSAELEPLPVGGLRDAARDATSSTTREVERADDEVERTSALMLAAAEMVPNGSLERARRLRVRSAESLALAFVEVEHAPGRWQRHDLVGGACELGSTPLPCPVRAPGHVATTARSIEDVLILEADALLVIEAPGLRECLRSIEPFHWITASEPSPTGEWHTRFAQLWTHGFTSDDRWAIAVTSEGLGPAFGFRRELELSALDRTYRLIEIEFHAVPGQRASWSFECPPAIATSALEVEIVRPEGEERGPLAYEIGSYAPREVYRKALKPAWGNIAFQPGLRFTKKGEADAGFKTIRLDDVPEGPRTAFAVRDLESLAYGRIEFVHDGSPRRVVLHPGYVVHGRITVPAVSALPLHVRVSFAPLADDPRYSFAEGVASDVHDLTVAADGTFEVRGPRVVPVSLHRSAAPPTTLVVRILASGFEVFECHRPLGAATRVDCGTLALVPSFTPLVLARGHGFESEGLEWATLRAEAVEKGEKRTWTIRNGRPELDDSLALVLDVDWSARNEASGDTPDEIRAEIDRARASLPVAEKILALIVDVDGDFGRAFVRNADGRYERVLEREYELDVGSSAGSDTSVAWRVGWEWRGIPQPVVSLGPERIGERRTLRFTAPRDDVRVWWSPQTKDDTAIANDIELGSMPLDAERVTLELP